MLTLTTLLPSYDANAIANVVDKESNVALYFNCCWPKECSGAIDDTIDIM